MCSTSQRGDPEVSYSKRVRISDQRRRAVFDQHVARVAVAMFKTDLLQFSQEIQHLFEKVQHKQETDR